LAPILSGFDSVHTFTSIFFIINFNAIYHPNRMFSCRLPHVCYMPHLYHLSTILRSLSLCNFLHHIVTSFISTNILFTILLPNTLNCLPAFTSRDQVSHQSVQD
jgi:hypothetical protein